MAFNLNESIKPPPAPKTCATASACLACFMAFATTTARSAAAISAFLHFDCLWVWLLVL